MMPLTLDTPIDDVFMIGPIMAGKLHKLNIYTVEDLLRHYPFRYEDFSIISKIAQVQIGETVTIRGKIISFKNIYTKLGKKIQQAQISDETGNIDVTWYNQPFLSRILKVGLIVNLSGKVTFFKNKLVLTSPEYEIDKPINIHTGRLVPVYPETYGVSSKWLRSRIAPLLRTLKATISDFLPKDTIEKYNFLAEDETLKQIHFPLSLDLATRARDRLSFDELFLIKLASLKRKSEWQKETVGKRFKVNQFQSKLDSFITNLPFKLTGAQNRSVAEILADLGKTTPTNRLLEGEVGSGKTVVATIAMYLAYLNKFSSVLMAPTEILAQQHYETVNKLLEPYGIKTALITRNSKFKISNLKFQIFVGTHALLSEKVTIKNLGLIVIDEQQRFGVEQRALLKEKGLNPHLLTMTATPIPRTMALTLYGELDLSIIDQLPKERKRVKTYVVPPEKREAAYEWIKKEINTHSTQAFVICPLIEDSESLESVKAAKSEYERLKKNIFPDLRLGLLHGRLKVKEKNNILDKFKDKQIDILVSTPIVEVGIDIPNATIMVIEAAERFGLTQLHQLRGRVGRGELQSYCLLFSEIDSETSLRRLKALEKTFIGAELAELDLRLRGPGEFFGTKQHGIGNLKIASLSDTKTIEIADKEAKNIIANTALIQSSPLRKALEKYTIKKISRD
ncbi:ATP-dependent DNA helicase RecG [Candidatus Gottesmanbacteria bacterium]|nr:ATP-dependent DNA helicase RecG [Candidatus Gottesmanbacteria bacterium]